MLRPAIRLLPALLAVGALAVPAAHAVAGASTSSTALGSSTLASPATFTHTRQVVVRPVTAAGTPAPGYAVRRESGPLSCEDASPSSVSSHVDICFPSALYTPSCWRASDHTALCLRNVGDRRLAKIRYRGRFVLHPALAPARRSPQGLVLGNGETCMIRVGGAWGVAPGHPSWVGFYSCARGAIYGTLSSGGVDRSHPVWTVHELRGDGAVVTRRVRRATYVGTAR